MVVRFLTLAGCLAIVNFAIASAAEVLPPESIPCFPGAYYRKAVSSFDQWTGIEGVVTLPTPTFDDSRRKPAGKYMDNASVYLGGRSGDQEVDAGLTWEIIREKDGSVSEMGRAFRPFWRVRKWNNAPAKPEYYFYPGDTVRMRCVVSGEGRLRLEIALLARPNRVDGPSSPSLLFVPAYALDSKEALTTTEVLTEFSTEFEAPDFARNQLKEFKRVNAIDQSGAEGKGVQPTNAKVEGAVWHQVWLRRGDDRLPMISWRFTDMRCPSPDHMWVRPVDQPERGGESLTLYGNPSEKPLLAP